MHLKRNSMPVTWPIQRKGTTFLAVPSHASSKGISLLFVLRNILKVARTRKEVQMLTRAGMVRVNSVVRKNESHPVQVFDIVSLEQSNKNYRLEIVNKKFNLREVTGKEAQTKIVKIRGKTVLKGKKVQMNLEDGQNILTKDSFNVGDSVIINTEKQSLEKILPLAVGAKIEIVAGKHAGQTGELMGFETLVREKNYIVKLGGREVTLPYKALLVVG